MKQKVVITIVLGMLLCGCSTPYRSATEESYSRLEGDIIEVTYYADTGVSDETVRDYCLLSCAEVTKRLGYTAFSVIESGVVSRWKTIEFFDPYKPHTAVYYLYTDRRDIPPWKYDAVPFEWRLEEPGFKYIIKCYKTVTPEVEAIEHFMPQEVLDELGTKYKIEMGEPVAGGDATRWRE